ncbi:MAG: hypothetical protein H7Z37_10965, partial [Pyrinomonadaceae bacterium]|nr:hypothetical protein [Pyrinomonadaceae bacterium]
MKRTLSLVTVSLLAISAFGNMANAQTRRPRTTKTTSTTTTNTTNAAATRANLTRIESQTGVFRASLDSSIDANPNLKNSEVEDDANGFLQDFDSQLSAVQTRSGNPTTNDVQLLLNQANNLNRLVRNNPFGSRVSRDWNSLRVSLNALAQTYKLNPNWDDTTVINNNNPRNTSTTTTGNQQTYGYNSRFTGTYSLDATRSDSAKIIATRAVTELPVNQREQARTSILQNVETPEKLAIDQRGQQITFASSRASRYTFVADGVDKTSSSDGQQMQIRATLNNDKLEVSTVNEQSNDYNVTYEMIDNGRGIKVTRQLATSYLSQPIVVTSFYGRTDDTAQLDLYERSNANGNANVGTGSGSSTSGSSTSGSSTPSSSNGAV